MKKKIEYLYLYISVLAKKHRKQLLLSVISGFFLTILSVQIMNYLSIYGRNRTEIIGVIGYFNENTLPLFIRSQISIGLTSLDKNMDPKPGAAERWVTDVTKKEYLFSIREGLLWHDGMKVKSSDLALPIADAVYSFPDDSTVKISLKEPYSPLPAILSEPIIRKNLIGMGNYSVSKIIKNEDKILQLRLNPKNKDSNTIIYKFYRDQKDAVTAFKLGEINTLKNISSLNDFSGWKNLTVRENDLYDRMIIVMLNLKKALFKEKEIRQALNYAVPKTEGRTRVVSPISPQSFAYSRKIRLYNNDEELAASILSKSSIASSSSEITLSTFSPLLSIAEEYKDVLNSLGLNVKVKVEQNLPPDYDMFLMVLPIPVDPDQYNYWQSTQDTNIGGYNNPKVDKLLEEGRKDPDRDSRIRIYADFQRYLVDDAPVVFMYYPKVYTVSR